VRPTRRSLLAAAMAGGLRMNASPDSNFRGQISAATVASLMNDEKLSRDALMVKLIARAKSHAHPPISNYFVGAVASGTSGSLYLGQNIEIPGNPLSLAVHGEQSAIANAYMSGEEGIDAIAVNGSPCGHCRQFLSEVSIDITMRVLMGPALEMKLSDLLPHAFGPKNLGFKRGAFPIARAHRSLSTASMDPLVLEALKAAEQAYSPYSRSPSGSAILTSTGRIFVGSYIENAAFNPSLPPLQAALAGYFAVAPSAGEIQRAVLLEGEKSTISQHTTTKSTLAAFAPTVHLERFTF
jgi:cytidine deaminase